MYSVGDGNSDVVGGLYINMYGGNKLSTKLKDGSRLQVEQQTNYPWMEISLLDKGSAGSSCFYSPAYPWLVQWSLSFKNKW